MAASEIPEEIAPPRRGRARLWALGPLLKRTMSALFFVVAGAFIERAKSKVMDQQAVPRQWHSDSPLGTKPDIQMGASFAVSRMPSGPAGSNRLRREAAGMAQMSTSAPENKLLKILVPPTRAAPS